MNETKAIKLAFGDHAAKLVVNSTKSMTGHLLGGAGGIESVFTVLALHHQVSPPTINIFNQDPECDLDYCANTAREMQDRRRGQEQLRLRRHQRHAGVRSRLSAAPALRLELRASRVMAAVIVSAHLAGAACLAAVLPGTAGGRRSPAGPAAGLGRGPGPGVAARAQFGAPPRAARRRGALFELADGRQLAGSVAGRRNVNRWWVTLPLRGESRRIVLVTRDMLPAGDFRRLRMWALWGRLANVATAPLPS